MTRGRGIPNRFRAAVVALGGLAALVTTVAPSAQSKPPSTGDGLRILPVRGPIYVIQGAGANITASVGRDGVLLVDTGTAQMSERILERSEARRVGNEG